MRSHPWSVGPLAALIRAHGQSRHDDQVRLADPGMADLVIKYHAGARTSDLATQFGVPRNIVQRLLEREGAILRRGTPAANEHPLER